MTETTSNSSESSSWSRSSFSSKSSSSRSSESLSSFSSESSSLTMTFSSFSSSSGTQMLVSSFSSSSFSSFSSSSSISSASSSSQSSESSSYSSPSSLTSLSSKSSSSISSKSSKSSSSTEIKTSSSSSSTEYKTSSSSNSSPSSTSSTSSGNRGTLSIAFRVEGYLETPVLCFSSREFDGIRIVYAGTGPNGVVLQSTDLKTWSTFMTVDDSHVKSIFVWANALFIGTQPQGKIYVYNFETENNYLFVETEDTAITAFAEYNGKLFVGTAPAGIVYSFDGIVWKEEHRPYGRGVTAMSVASAGLFVFSNGAEGPVVFDGDGWKAYFEEKAEEIEDKTKLTTGISVAANRIAENGIYGSSGNNPISRQQVVSFGSSELSDRDVSQTKPASPQFNVSAAATTPLGTIFGGIDNGVVLLAKSDGIVKVCDIGEPVVAITYLNENHTIISSNNTIFLAREITSDNIT